MTQYRVGGGKLLKSFTALILQALYCMLTLVPTEVCLLLLSCCLDLTPIHFLPVASPL